MHSLFELGYNKIISPNKMLMSNCHIDREHNGTNFQ